MLFYRRLTYITFIIIFLVAAPLIVLYTQGYRYDFKRGRVQKTGILIISSIPKKAEIYLNGQLSAKTTPAEIEKLLPADYEIKLAKEGYHDWQKKLPIYENSTTFAEKIILWKNSQPEIIAQKSISDWLASPNNEKIATIAQDQELIAIFLGGNQTEILYQFKDYSKIKIIGWSNTSKKILIQAGEPSAADYYVVNAEEGAKTGIQKITSRRYQAVKWDLENDNLLYGLDQSGVWQIDLFRKSEKLIAAGQLSDFLVMNNNIYSIQDGNVFSRPMNSQKNELLAEIKCDNCKFVEKKTKRLVLLDAAAQNIFIIDPENKNKIISEKAKAVSWLDNDTMLFFSDWEIFIYDYSKKEAELITRLGSMVNQVVWHSDGRHLIFLSDNKIRVIEMDNRELRNTIELANLPKINYLNIDKQGENLYFAGEQNNQENIFRLNIQ